MKDEKTKNSDSLDKKISSDEKEKSNEKKEYKPVENYEKKKGKGLLIASIVIIMIILIGMAFSTIFALININNSTILKGVYINEIDVSGMTIEQANNLLNNIIEKKKKNDILLSYNEYETTIGLNQIEVEYNTEEIVREAYKKGREGNIFQNNFEILKLMFNNFYFKLGINYNEQILNTAIDDISTKLPGTVIESSYYIEDDNIIITRGKEGVIANAEELTNLIEDVALNINEEMSIIKIPVEIKQPKEIDIEKIHEEIYKKSENAYVTTNPVKVYIGSKGVDFAISIEEVKKLIQEEKEEYQVPLKYEEPEVTINDLGEEIFPELIATFTTRYDASNKNRSTNLSLAANKINNCILLPGEVFSYNKIVGERTIAAGYKDAKIYSNGKVVDGLGGGICQISSTLYNSVLMANLEVVTRRNHQFVTSYVSAGRDATVVYGSQDFEFKNTRSYPIKIKASVQNGIAKIDIYGIKDETEYEVVIEARKVESIPYTTSYINDSTLNAGKEVVEQAGANGCKTETYKILKLNGQVVSRTLVSKDTYNAMQRVIKRGTKKAVVTNTPNPEEIVTE